MAAGAMFVGASGIRLGSSGTTGSLSKLVLPKNSTPYNMYCEGNFFPLLLVNVGLTSPSIDPPWLQFLQGLGVGGIRYQTDLPVYQAFQTRYQASFNAAAAAGLPIHLVNTLDISGFNQEIGVSPDFPSTPPTWTEFLNQNLATVEAFMVNKPHMISVLTEPQDVNNRLKANFTQSQYASAVKQMTSQIKAYSPDIKTCLKILYDSKFDIQTAQDCMNDPNLDTIALDIYGSNNGTTFSATSATNLANGIKKGGKLVGVGETWREPLFELPSLDSPSNEPLEADWITTVGNWAISNGATSTFLPFYSNKFISSAKMVNPFTVKTGTQYWTTLQQQLESCLAGQLAYQPTYQAYQQIIS
jgi:hypothetical protein